MAGDLSLLAHRWETDHFKWSLICDFEFDFTLSVVYLESDNEGEFGFSRWAVFFLFFMHSTFHFWGGFLYFARLQN